MEDLKPELEKRVDKLREPFVAFIAHLALPTGSDALDSGKLAIMVASAIAAVGGILALRSGANRS